MSPDYVLVPSSKRAELLHSLEKYYHQFFPNGALQSPDWGKIINDAHHERLNKLLHSTRGSVHLGGKSSGPCKLEPTVVIDVQADDALMEE